MRPLTLTLAAVSLLAAAPALGAEPPVGDGRGATALQQLGEFEAPVYAANAPGKKNRRLTFVVERAGTIKVIRGTTTLRRPFLDLSGRVGTEGERGLLSIAFARDYNRSRTVYAYFVNRDGNIVVSRFKRARNSKVRANPRSVRRVIRIPHGGLNHFGGTVAPGPNGTLWLAPGDGGGGCDPAGRAQNPRTLLGKLLRIEPRRKGGYKIPRNNPFRGKPGRGEIWSVGLRNPFRFAIDDRSRTLTIADVGEASWEEINHTTLRGARGANFGWNAYEGSHPSGCSGAAPLAPSRHTGPIHEYPHTGIGFTGCSVTGGVIARDRRLPHLWGRYLYTDFCRAEIRSLIPSPSRARGDSTLGVGVMRTTSITSGFRGRILVSSMQGGVYRLQPGPGSG